MKLLTTYRSIKISLAFTFIILVNVFSVAGQASNPVPQSLPYFQDFTSLASSSNVYPAGWQGWRADTSSFYYFPGNTLCDSSLVPNGTAANQTSGIYNYHGKIGMLSSLSNNIAICLALNTTGISNVQVSFDMMCIRNPYNGTTVTRINFADLQYRVGTVDSFVSVSGLPDGIYSNNTTTQLTGTAPLNSQTLSLTLPSACNDQPVVQIRWVQRDNIGNGQRPSFAIDNVSICSSSVTPTISISGPSLFCSGTPVTYSAAVTNEGAIPTFQWQINGVDDGSNNSTFNTIALADGDVVTCILTSSAACLTVETVTSADLDVTVNPNPLPPVVSAIGSTTFCNPGSVDLDATSGYSEYHWSNGQTVQTITATTSGIFNVYVVDVNNCQSDVSADVVVTANNCCLVPFNLTATNITSTGATLNWDPSITADSFLVKYYLIGDTARHYRMIQGGSGNTCVLSQVLQPLHDYKWRVKGFCNGTTLGYQSKDSLFSTIDGQAACIVPYGFYSLVSATSATICWDDRVTADYFFTRINKVGIPSFTYKIVTIGANVVGPHCVTYSGLQPSTTYDFKVKGICNGVSTGYNYAEQFQFTTNNNPAPCPSIAPYGLTSSHISPVAELVSWDTHVVADSFLIRYKEASGINFYYQKILGTNSFTVLSGLIAGTNYVWWVRGICNGLTTHYSSPGSFKTSISRMQNTAVLADLSLTAFPVPAHNIVTVTFNGNEHSNYVISLSDITGRIVYTTNVAGVNGQNIFDINLNRFNAGIYILNLRTEGVEQNLKLFVQ